jgi:hypothetical protein
MPVGTVCLGVRITTDCIGYRVETEDMIYILEYCYNPVVQHPWPADVRAACFALLAAASVAREDSN